MNVSVKKPILFFLCTSFLFLTGCGGIYDGCLDTERLIVAETLGIDYIPGGVRVSCASSMGGNEPVKLTGVGVTVEAALDNIRSRYTENRLFVRHTENIIVGEDAARHGLEDIMEYICRSPEMRIDTPFYILRGGTASALMEDADNISRSMEGIADDPDGALCFTASDILSDMLRRSAALVCTLATSRSSENTDEVTVSVSGSAVIKNYRLCSFLDRNETLGAAFLTDRVTGGTLTLKDSRLGAVTLTVTGGGSDIVPIVDESGKPTGLSVSAELRGTVSEIDGGVAAGSAVYMRHLTDVTEEYVSEKINTVLRLAASLGTDFPGLGERAGLGSDFAELLPTLEAQVTVNAVLSHTNDMRDSV